MVDLTGSSLVFGSLPEDCWRYYSELFFLIICLLLLGTPLLSGSQVLMSVCSYLLYVVQC